MLLQLVVCSGLVVITTANCVREQDGQIMPKPMKMDTFNRYISGKTYSALLRFESPMWINRTTRLECLFRTENTSDGSEGLAMEVKYRDENGNCNNVVDSADRFRLYKQVKFPYVKFAHFDAPNVFEAGIYSRYIISSSHPEKYYFLFGCFDELSIEGDRCMGSFYFDLAVRDDPPHRVPWNHVEKDMWSFFQVKWTDERFHWLYINDACPGLPERTEPFKF